MARIRFRPAGRSETNHAAAGVAPDKSGLDPITIVIDVVDDRRGPNDTPFGIPRAVSLDGRSLGPHHGAAHPGADPGQKILWACG